MSRSNIKLRFIIKPHPNGFEMSRESDAAIRKPKNRPVRFKITIAETITNSDLVIIKRWHSMQF